MTVVASLRFAGEWGWVGVGGRKGGLILNSVPAMGAVGWLFAFSMPCSLSYGATKTNVGKVYPHYDFVLSLSFFSTMCTQILQFK
jgi:hypothetical protein